MLPATAMKRLEALATISIQEKPSNYSASLDKSPGRTERRRQLDLQVSLLLDEKMSKLITMVDELRRVHPAFEDTNDGDIDALKKTVDPHQSLETLDHLLNTEEG